MLEHLLGVEVSNQEGNVVALVPDQQIQSKKTRKLPAFMAFLRNMKNASALCVKNLVNLCTNMFSISSACFILMLTLTLLMLGSISTFSFSFRETVRGFSRTSGELAASISGTLCRSEVCDAKFERDSAAVRDERTHCR